MEYIKHRQYVYVCSLLVHTLNLIYLAIFIQPYITVYPELLVLKNLQPRFFTIWTVVLQMVYSAVGLTCDMLEARNQENKNYKINRRLRGFRDTLFSSVVWPSVWVVAIVFWTLSLYDKALIFPHNSDTLLNPISNHIMHTIIVPIAIWELVYRQRKQPSTHRRNFKYMAFHFALYFVVITYTYYERGIWIYPIFSKFYGTMYFPLIHTVISGIAICAYFAQWPTAHYLWREDRSVKKVD